MTIMRKTPLFWGFLFIAFLLNSCKKDPAGPEPPPEDTIQPLPAITIAWTPDKSIVCFGTSLTYGYRFYAPEIPFAVDQPDVPYPSMKEYIDRLSSVAFNVDSSYPYYLGQRLKIRVENQGYVGARTTRALDVIDDSVLTKNPALVLLEFGANDMLQRVPPESAEVRLNLLVEKIRNHGSAVVLISFTNPDLVNQVPPNSALLLFKEASLAYFAMLKRVSVRYSIPMVDYPLKGIFSDDAYMSDMIHPNGAGYRKMEANIAAALALTFSQNGMLR